MIIKKGEKGDKFFMLQSGRVVCKDIVSSGRPAPDVTLDAGCFFGERALLMDTPRAANVIAASPEVRSQSCLPRAPPCRGCNIW